MRSSISAGRAAGLQRACERAGAQVEAQLVELKVLVKNLIDNAIRYTPDGGRVDITVGSENGSVTLQVDDTGPSIPLVERDRVFAPFLSRSWQW